MPKPACRLRYTGKMDDWDSDEYWDHRGAEVGAPEDLMLSMIVERLC